MKPTVTRVSITMKLRKYRLEFFIRAPRYEEWGADRQARRPPVGTEWKFYAKARACACRRCTRPANRLEKTPEAALTLSYHAGTHGPRRGCGRRSHHCALRTDKSKEFERDYLAIQSTRFPGTRSGARRHPRPFRPHQPHRHRLRRRAGQLLGQGAGPAGYTQQGLPDLIRHHSAVRAAHAGAAV